MDKKIVYSIVVIVSVLTIALFIMLFEQSGSKTNTEKGADAGYDELQFLREYDLPEGWVMEERGEGSITVFEFSNEDLICKSHAMGQLETPWVILRFGEKWTAEDYAENAAARESFLNCSRNNPNPLSASPMASVPPEIINCRNESGLRDEPSYNTKNYAVFVDTNCIGDESFDPDYFGETQFLEDIRSALEDEP